MLHEASICCCGVLINSQALAGTAEASVRTAAVQICCHMILALVSCSAAWPPELVSTPIFAQDGSSGSHQFDVVVANILKGPLLELAPRLASYTRPGGRLLLSGILLQQVNTIAPYLNVAVWLSYVLVAPRVHIIRTLCCSESLWESSSFSDQLE